MENWARGDAYEFYIGRWSRKVAPEFLTWLDPPPQARWLDCGCGTGALSAAILRAADPASVVGVDPSEGFLERARTEIGDRRIRFELGDARTLPVDDDSVDVAVSGLVLNFVPEPAKAAAELARVTRSGGLAGAYVWDYAEGMQLIRHFFDAAIALDPAAEELDEARRFPVCRPDGLADLWRGAGFIGTEVRAVEIPTVFTDFDDYWNPFLGGQGPAPTYVMSLPEDRRAALREELRRRLPAEPDGSIHLTARAWAVRGQAA
jgi:SAM-dependent methyltransferase